MPARPDADHVIQMVVSGTSQSGIWANIWYMKYGGGPASVADLTDIYTFASAQILRPWIHNMGTNCNVTLVKFTDLTSTSGAQYENTTVSAGTNSGNTQPASACVLVKHSILRRYRGGHPRHYLPFGVQNDFANNISWTTGFLANCLNDIQAMITMLNSFAAGSITSLEVGNLSYVSGGAERATPVFDPFINTAVATRICSQRRRLGKVGG